ncbi:MAG: hypothetical protein WBN16_02445 [Lutimonas sp.]
MLLHQDKPVSSGISNAGGRGYSDSYWGGEVNHEEALYVNL